MTQEELKEIIERHQHWLNEDCEDWENMRANLTGAKNVPHIPMACPTDGSFIGWKKAMRLGSPLECVLLKLLIPEDARRSSATTNKCRCDKAKVLEITVIGTGEPCSEALANYDKKFIYRVGETVTVDDFCTDRFKECAKGIHFFVDKQTAIDYRI